MAEQRRKFSGQLKAKIVREGLAGTRPISELCRHYGIAAAQYYDWQRRFLDGAQAAMEDRPKSKHDRSEVQLQKNQAQMLRFKSVIAEITAENLELKKTLGD